MPIVQELAQYGYFPMHAFKHHKNQQVAMNVRAKWWFGTMDNKIDLSERAKPPFDSRAPRNTL